MSDTHAQTVAYVRTTMLPPQDPPRAEAGAIKWLRENMFSSWLNVILTLLSLYLIWSVLALILPWAARGIWDAASLTECRAIRDQLYGEGSDVACWAVISDRWQQLHEARLFGGQAGKQLTCVNHRQTQISAENADKAA